MRLFWPHCGTSSAPERNRSAISSSPFSRTKKRAACSGRTGSLTIIPRFLLARRGGSGGWGEVRSDWLVENDPEVFAGATEAISEVGGYSITIDGKRAYLLQTGEKGLLWLRLRSRGAAAHGSRHIRDNAITALAEAVVRLGRMEWPVRLTATTRELLAGVAKIVGVDPHERSPDELARATGTAAGFVT